LKAHEHITLQRDCEAIQIPSGERLRLNAGTVVTLHQSLGGSFTVTTDHGTLARIAGNDADALGLARPAPEHAPAAQTIDQQVWEQLRTCYDPEIPVNIVELGLVYHSSVRELPGGGHRAEVKLTLTAPGCGMGPILKSDVENKIAAIPGITELDVELVWDPPWNPSMMSEAAKLQLGMV